MSHNFTFPLPWWIKEKRATPHGHCTSRQLHIGRCTWLGSAIVCRTCQMAGLLTDILGRTWTGQVWLRPPSRPLRRHTRKQKQWARAGIANPFCFIFATVTLSDNESVAIHLVFRNLGWYGCLTTPPWLSCVTCVDCRGTHQKQEAELQVWFLSSRRISLNFNSCQGFKWPRGPITLCRSVTWPECTSIAHWAALQCVSEGLVKLAWTGNTVFSKQFLWLTASFPPCLHLLARAS